MIILYVLCCKGTCQHVRLYQGIAGCELRQLEHMPSEMHTGAQMQLIPALPLNQVAPCSYPSDLSPPPPPTPLQDLDQVVHSGGESLFRALQQLHSSAEFMRKRAVNKAAALEEYRAEEESEGLRLVRQVSRQRRLYLPDTRFWRSAVLLHGNPLCGQSCQCRLLVPAMQLGKDWGHPGRVGCWLRRSSLLRAAHSTAGPSCPQQYPSVQAAGIVVPSSPMHAVHHVPRNRTPVQHPARLPCPAGP